MLGNCCRAPDLCLRRGIVSSTGTGSGDAASGMLPVPLVLSLSTMSPVAAAAPSGTAALTAGVPQPLQNL